MKKFLVLLILPAFFLPQLKAQKQISADDLRAMITIGEVMAFTGTADPGAFEWGGFTVTLTKASGEVITARSDAERFSQEVLRLFSRLQAGDVVTFGDIKAKASDGSKKIFSATVKISI